MIYNNVCGEKLSLLGFGTMRLPLREDKTIDEEQVGEMTDLALQNGVNYFDTAFPYHGGLSEIVIGKALKKHPRESFYLASKYPGHQIADKYDPKDIFEKQLKKCQVDYFDFYLLHNVYEKSVEVYEDERWGIIEYFKEQKRLGRIKHLGFSTHGRPEMIKSFLEKYADIMEFCQIQLNYLDWTLQDAKEKVDILNSYNIPIWVMEPIRGGRLARLTENETNVLGDLGKTDTPVHLAFRFVQSIEGVKMVLSGMSNLEQMKDNIATFNSENKLNEEEISILLSAAEEMKKAVPCTGCRYCCEGCPMGINIPDVIKIYNDIKFGGGTLTPSMQLEDMEDAGNGPSSCLSCGACSGICPQNIDIPKIMEELSGMISSLPSWKKMCAERLALAKALEEKEKSKG